MGAPWCRVEHEKERVESLPPSLLLSPPSSLPPSLPPSIPLRLSLSLSLYLKGASTTRAGGIGGPLPSDAMREHLESFRGLLPEGQGQNLALAVLSVAHLFDSGARKIERRVRVLRT
jgi:hypothetical protein